MDGCTVDRLECGMQAQTYTTDDIDALRHSARLHETPWLIACLCAAWCDTCQAYRKGFDALALHHPDKCLAWVDIEDHADLVHDLDIENFPTLLIQYGDKLLFLGTMLPDPNLVDRLLRSFVASIETSGIDSISAFIQASNPPIPADFNFRHAILNN